MTLDIHWSLTVQVPQLETLTDTLVLLGDKLVAELSVIQDAIVALTTQQAQGQQALSAHLTAIEEEIAQLNAETITQEQLDALAAQIHAAAGVSAKGVTDLQAMTEQVKGMVPDTPPSP